MRHHEIPGDRPRPVLANAGRTTYDSTLADAMSDYWAAFALTGIGAVAVAAVVATGGVVAVTGISPEDLPRWDRRVFEGVSGLSARTGDLLVSGGTAYDAASGDVVWSVGRGIVDPLEALADLEIAQADDLGSGRRARRDRGHGHRGRHRGIDAGAGRVVAPAAGTERRHGERGHGERGCTEGQDTAVASAHRLGR